jgi:predicted RND superfamily exporter protein
MWAVRHPKTALLLILAFTAATVYGNLITRRGSILDEPIVDPTDPFRISDEYVADKLADGFHGGEYIPFIIRFPGGISSVQDLEKIRTLTDRVKSTFGSSVLSLSVVSDYRDTGDMLLNDPFIPDELPPDFSLPEWKARVANDPSVYGSFVGRDFEWAAVLRYLPPDYDEIVEFRRTVEFLEERQVPPWEWIYKADIDAPPGISVSGWVIGRGLIDQGFNADYFKLVTVGIGLALPILTWSLGSFRQALVGVIGIVLLGLAWTRGSIGLLDAMGFAFRERVYVLVAYANCIVQGVSFVLHKFEAFRAAQSKMPGAPAKAVWEKATTNDRLIGTTAFVAILGFGTLYSFEVISIRELGFFSALAVAYQFTLTLLWIPAFHVLIAPRGPVTAPAPTPTAKWFTRFVDALVRACARMATAYPPKSTAMGIIALIVVINVVGLLLIWPGNLLLYHLEPLKLVRGTIVERTGEFLNQPGRVGFDFYEMYIEPADEDADIHSPGFLSTLNSFTEALRRENPLVREVVWVGNQIGRISEESYGKAFPTTRQESRGAFLLLESNTPTAVARQLYHDRGVRLSVSYAGDDTTIANEIGNDAIRLIDERYPDLNVHTFGRASLAPRLDYYVRWGKPLNVLSSHWVVIIVCTLGLSFHNRELRRRRRTAYVSPLLGGFVMSAPFVFATAVMALMMIVLRVPLDAATAAITALAINASIDFSIYCADAYQEGLSLTENHRKAVYHALRTKGRVILEDMVLNSVCFLPLVFSRFSPIQHTGWMMFAMLITCAVGAVVFMPALFYLCIRPAPALAEAPERQAPAAQREAARQGLTGDLGSPAPVPMEAKAPGETGME